MFIGLGDQLLIEPLARNAGLVAGDQQHRLALRVEGERDPPSAASNRNSFMLEFCEPASVST
jgi:hypothetical protein